MDKLIIDSSLRMIDVLVINRSGPWKGGRGAGRARRGLSVIIEKKNDVNVNLSGFENLSSKGAKNRNYLRLNGL